MKKNILLSIAGGIILFLLLLILVFKKPDTLEQTTIPEKLESYIPQVEKTIEFRRTLYKAKKKIPDTVSKFEALEDIALLRYLFETSYSGYDYWKTHGVNFDRMFSVLQEYAQNNDPAMVTEIESIIHQELKNMNDGHLHVVGKQEWNPYRHKEPFFADIRIEKNGTEFFVTESLCDGIKPGMRYTGDTEELFLTLSPEGKQHYIPGVLSFEYTVQHEFFFENSGILLPMHRGRMIRREFDCNEPFKKYDSQGITVLVSRSFSKGTSSIYEEFAESGSALKNAKSFILDICGNSGGLTGYSHTFFKNLNGKANWSGTYAELISPAIIQNMFLFRRGKLAQKSGMFIKSYFNTKKKWQNMQIIAPVIEGNYSGTAVVVADKKVVSAGEGCIAISRSVPGMILVGENTAGISSFGEIKTYFLKNTGIRVVLPSKIIMEDGCSDGIGFSPDYWIDSSEPVEETIRWLTDKQGYHFHFKPPAKTANLNFEEWNDDCPAGMICTDNILLRGKDSIAVKDTEIFYEGGASLRLQGDKDTEHCWLFTSLMPDSSQVISADFFVKGENIRCNGRQYDNCYAGFVYETMDGRSKYCIQKFEETFNWKECSVTLDVQKAQAVLVKFAVFFSKSGIFWIDNVRFRTKTI